MLAELLTGREDRFGGRSDTIPSIERKLVAEPLLPGGGRLLRTHEQYRRSYRRAVYLVRHPADVCISYFEYQKLLGLEMALDDFVLSFVGGTTDGYGPWGHHVTSWLDQDRCPVEVVRYEDLSENPKGVVHSIAQFLDIPCDDESVARVVANNSLERMRQKALELSGDSSQHPHRYVRSAVVGEGRQRLAPEHRGLIRTTFGHAMARLDYSL